MHKLVVAFEANDPDFVSGFDLFCIECRRFDRCVTDRRRIVGDHRQVVQWMHILNLASNFE